MIKSSPGQQVNISLIDFGYDEGDKKRCFGWVQQFNFSRGNSKFTILPYPFKFCISFISSFISLCLISQHNSRGRPQKQRINLQRAWAERTACVYI